MLTVLICSNVSLFDIVSIFNLKTVLDISFTATDYQVEESSNLTVEVCIGSEIAREYPNLIEVFLSSLVVETVGEPLSFLPITNRASRLLKLAWLFCI